MKSNSTPYEDLYVSSVYSLDVLQQSLSSQNIDFEKIISIEGGQIPSNLDCYDLVFALVFGAMGAFITTNKSISELSNHIHEIASADLSKGATGGEKFVHMLLGHSNDWMDKVKTPEIGSSGGHIKKYLTRNAKKIGKGIFEGSTSKIPHRILWGHDVFSLGNDNPFKLMIEQYGFSKGITQAIKHLVADTFSTQGLPLPSHSFFDYTDSDGDLRNRLFNIANGMMKESGIDRRGTAFNCAAFNEMFSIHMQDIGSQGLLTILALSYFKAREITNDIRKVQFRLIAYSVNFFASTLAGAIQHNGVPHINWVALLFVIKNFSQLYIKSGRETKALQELTNELVQKNIALEQKVFDTGNLIHTYAHYWEYVDEYEREQSAGLNLIDIFEEV